jgi:hypothetical protein
MNNVSGTLFKSRRIRIAASTVALALASIALLAPADATTPPGSRAQVILETKNVTGQPYYASLHGWWGHEGGTKDTGVRATYLSLDASNGRGVVGNSTISALHKKLGDGGSFSSLRVAFVPYSADGHNERPQVTKGENAGKAFRWFSDLGFGSGLNGKKGANDFVTWVSTLGEYSKWWQAGRPVQGFTKQLKVLDIPGTGPATLSPTPEGASILNRWPAGTKISLVFYLSDGVDKAMRQVPTVRVGKDGRAMTSWLTFETVASPTDAVRTSGGYKVLTGAGTGPGPNGAVKPTSTATGQSAGAQTGASTSASRQPVITSPKAAADKTDDGGLMGSLPGGQPTAYTLLVLILAGIAGSATLALRARKTR